MRVFVAGAAGVIGRRLVPILLERDHAVAGTTRRPDRAEALRAAGVEPFVLDVFDAIALAAAVRASRPEVVVHQLTDLAAPPGAPYTRERLERNARIREVGTSNLVAAAVAGGASRLVAQSLAFVYAPGPLPHVESDPLVDDPADVTARGVRELERLVTTDPRFDGLVLRYGRLYGPGTDASVPPQPPAVHVDAAAVAAALAAERGETGIYDIADDDGAVSVDRARALLGWSPDWRSARD